MSCLSNKRYPFQCSIALKKFLQDREAKWSLILDWGMQEYQKEALLILTKSPCVCWLCKVFWHLPVDVKPERGKATAIKQVEHFNTLHIPTGMNDAEVFPSSFPNFFSLQKNEQEKQNKTKTPFSFVQLCNHTPSWLQFPKHFSLPPSALLSWTCAIWTVRGVRKEVLLDKFINHRKRIQTPE